MKPKVPGWVVVVAVVVVVVLVAFFGWKQLKPPETLSTAPPSFIDPVTRRPKGMGPGSGAPTDGQPAGATAAPGQTDAGGK